MEPVPCVPRVDLNVARRRTCANNGGQTCAPVATERSAESKEKVSSWPPEGRFHMAGAQQYVAHSVGSVWRWPVEQAKREGGGVAELFILTVFLSNL